MDVLGFGERRIHLALMHPLMRIPVELNTDSCNH